ncbi:MAG TPA: type II secretion system minor pseudopilin GspH [Steroidobacteraceae bacterium]
MTARRSTDGAGFTLIEIMVVVVIIAIVAAGAIIAVSLTGRDHQLERESERLLQLIIYVREQAEMQTREFGLQCVPDGYQFVSYDSRHARWRAVDEDDALRLRTLPDGLALRLTVEGRAVVLKHPAEADEPVPHVMLFSNGDLTAFELTVQREAGRSVTLASDENGKVILKPMVEHAT